MHDLYYFPLRPETKVPIYGFSWRKDSSNDPARVQAWMESYPECNWGIDCEKSGLTVLDIDVKDGKPGEKTLLEWELDHGLLPPTQEVETPSGGRHYYYHGLSATRSFLKEGIDIKSVGGYVVAPGSRIGSGHYLKKGDGAHIVPVPEWLVEKAGRPYEKAHKDKASLVDLDKPKHIQEGVLFLRLEDTVMVGTRGTRVYQAACHLRDLGISQSMTVELIEEHLTIQDAENWDESVGAKVRHAYRYAQNQPGCKTQEGKSVLATKEFKGFHSIEGPEETTAQDEPASGWLQLSDFLGTPAPEREWIIQDWLPAGYSSPTLFTGAGGTGKSLLALQLALAVSTGGDWVGLPVVRQMDTTLVMCEDSKDELHRRIESLAKADQYAFTELEKAGVYMMSRVGQECVLCVEKDGRLAAGPFYEVLDQQLGILGPQEKLLVIDTAADVYSGNESNRSGVNQFVKHILCGLAAKHNATVMLVAHPPKAIGQTYSGSTAWNNSFRNRLFLDWFENGGRKFRTLDRPKSNYAECGEKLILAYEHGAFKRTEQVKATFAYDTLVMQAIRMGEQGDSPLSLAYQSSCFVGSAVVLDPQGRNVPKEILIETTKRLVAEGKVKNVTGKSRDNGLYVVDHLDLLEG